MKAQSTIHIFLGDDGVRSGDALRRAVDAAKAKDPNALVSRFDGVAFDPALLREALVNQSIFGGGNIVIIDNICEHKEGEEFYREMEKWEGITNTVFIRERACPKDILSLLKSAGVIEEFPLKKVSEQKNAFAIADAVAMRDKRSAWVELVKLERAGAAMEEVHGMIFWAVKSLYICATQTKDEALKAGVKEFTYRTYQPRSKKFLVSELEEWLGELKEMYHRAHQGDAELSLFLEQFLLKL
jgi:DNA polymerase III delta subunit